MKYSINIYDNTWLMVVLFFVSVLSVVMMCTIPKKKEVDMVYNDDYYDPIEKPKTSGCAFLLFVILAGACGVFYLIYTAINHFTR